MRVAVEHVEAQVLAAVAGVAHVDGRATRVEADKILLGEHAVDLHRLLVAAAELGVDDGVVQHPVLDAEPEAAGVDPGGVLGNGRDRVAAVAPTDLQDVPHGALLWYPGSGYPAYPGSGAERGRLSAMSAPTYGEHELPRDCRRVVGHQQQDQVGEILGHAVALQRHRRRDGVEVLLTHGRADVLGGRRAGRDREHSDPRRPQLDRHRRGQVSHR